MDLSLFGQSRDAERRRPVGHPILALGSPTPRARGPTRRSTQLNTLLWLPQSGASEEGHFLSLRRTQTLHSPGLEKSLNLRGFLSAMGSFVHYFSPTRKSRKSPFLEQRDNLVTSRTASITGVGPDWLPCVNYTR